MKNFKVFKNNDLELNSLAIESTRIDKCLDYMKSNGITCITLNSEWGWNKKTPLSFIENNLWIEGVDIVDGDLNLSVINSLENLKYLKLSGEKYTGVLDFMNFKTLKSYIGNFNNKLIKNFETSRTIEYLNIFKYPFLNLDCLSNLINLKCLIISYGKLSNLNGIEKLTNLYKLDFYSLPNLSTLDLIGKIHERLKILSIDKCRNLTCYEDLKYLLNIERLFIAESGAINSISFIQDFKSLNYCYINVDILDNNTEFLEVRNFQYKKKKVKHNS